MFVTLQITSGPLAGRKVRLRAGQTLQVGRTDWADFSVPADTEMADVHFALACHAGACTVRDLGSTVGILLNGNRVGEAVVRAGDVIQAGQTQFAVRIDDPAGTTAGVAAVAGAGVAAHAAPGVSSGFAHVATPLAIEVCKKVSLDDDARAMLTDRQTCRQFFELLVGRELFSDATRFLAQALQRREAVWWATRCVRQFLEKKLTPADRAALEAAESWAKESTEEHRRAAEKAAEATHHETAAGWAAAAAFFSGDSIAPPGMPPVAPKDTLAGQAVYVSVKMTAAVDEPREAAARYRASLQIGAAVADGKNRWPEGAASK